jgi:hypothetical protein
LFLHKEKIETKSNKTIGFLSNEQLFSVRPVVVLFINIYLSVVKKGVVLVFNSFLKFTFEA